MKIGFLFLLFTAKVCFAHPLIENTEPDPSAIVANHFNVITGNDVISPIDVIVTGEYPIVMQRSPAKDWQWFCHNYAVMLKKDQSIQVSDSNGTHLSFVPESKQKLTLSADSVKAGYCNTSRGEVCAKHDITNAYIDVESCLTGFYLHLSDGTVRYYRGIGKDQNQNEHFLLEREKHPNGYFTHYEYHFSLKQSTATINKSKRYPKTRGLKRVYTTGANYDHTYSWLSIDCTTESYVVTTSDNKAITFDFKDLQTKSLQLASESDERITFKHNPDKKNCRVIDPNGAYRIFHYTQERRLCKIEHFTKEGECLKSEVLKWNGHRLYKRELLDENGLSIKKHIYKYDPFGNIIAEHIFGGEDHTVIEKSYSSDGRFLIAEKCEDHLTTYTYDTRQRQETKTVHNGDNTLVYRTSYNKQDQPYCVSIESPDGYVYAKEPCQSKAVLPAQQKTCTIKKSNGIELYDTYDIFGNITSLKSSDHTLHLSYTYNHLGQLLTARDEIAKTTTTRTWDAHGNLTSETLANGATLTYAYDQANNRIELTYPDHSRILYTYKGPYLNTVTYLDQSGQPVFSHNHKNTTNHEPCNSTLDPQATHSYDVLGRLTRVTKGGSTYIYTYDALHRCIQCNNISYYYDGQNRIGTSANEKRILGPNGATLAVIISNQIYTPPIPTEVLSPWNSCPVKQPPSK